jgi:hypothetical protein
VPNRSKTNPFFDLTPNAFKPPPSLSRARNGAEQEDAFRIDRTPALIAEAASDILSSESGSPSNRTNDPASRSVQGGGPFSV